MPYDVNFGVLLPYLGDFVAGFWLTIQLGVLALVISLPAGLGGALLRTSKSRSVRSLTAVYVEVIRDIPLLVLIYIFFYQLPAVGLKFDSFGSGVAALAVNSTAYVVEIFRGGLAAIPRGQYEAAHALGMRPHQVFRFVILPQLMGVSFPALGNQVCSVLLGSSLVYVVGVSELTTLSYRIGAHTFRYFEVFVIAAMFYFMAVQITNRVWVRYGRRWTATLSTRTG